MSMHNKFNIGKMTKATQSKIIKDGIMSGSPRIAGTRIRVRDIVEKHVVLDYSPEEVAEAFDISLAAVHEALSYYYEHTEEVQEEIRKDKEFVEKFRKDFKHEILS
ncbi:DUF433 domain-containing protein [Candidatus Woesearchaeota archaeon]|nr:DUF433 domain-containing protein [Candidatus Woesearchaeota archaeon]